MRKDLLRSIAIAVGGICVGAGVGYIVASKRLEKGYAEWALNEIQSVKDSYKLLRKEPPYDNPITARQAYINRVDELEYLSRIDPEEEPALFNTLVKEKKVENLLDQAADIRLNDTAFDSSATVHLEKSPSGPTEIVNIFDQDDKAPVIVIDRTADKYIIPVQEYMETGLSTQLTLTYYEMDGVLVDEGDEQVDIDVVDAENLYFGHLSGDTDIVYVRNDALSVDLEVHRHEGSYSQQVLGVPPKESPLPKVRRRESPDG